ncbi:hypothetical protein GCM10010347_42120 [Streptomyces cirratus]|uniref:Uncharacterized protein n=1 Tax=Streptomyces cirratus TaxID=68187 RepID=A0ABQ3F022_9ACTN|nr:hypothetical protein GCM10010347_42120 [Streptomyces cirratus]
MVPTDGNRRWPRQNTVSLTDTLRLSSKKTLELAGRSSSPDNTAARPKAELETIPAQTTETVRLLATERRWRLNPVGFTNTLWPDYTHDDFHRALDEYRRRNRRHGA